MEKQLITTSGSPRISLVAHGNLRIKGTDDLEVIAKTDSADNLEVDQDGDDISITCNTDCMIKVPRDSVIDIKTANGNTSLKALDGELQIQDVDGNLELKNVGATRLVKANGEVFAKHVDGDLSIERVEGNVTVRDVQGTFKVTGTIQGNLSLDDIEDSASARVEGNLTLRFDPLPGEKYEFEADGNIICRLPEDASVELEVSRASQLQIKISGQQTSRSVVSNYQLTLGEGDASLKLSAEGNISILGRAPDWEMSEDFDADFGHEFSGMADQIGEQVTRQMEMLESQLDAQMENLTASMGALGIPPESAERMAQKAREASARVTARAQEQMQRAQERIRRKMEVAQRRAEQKARAAERRSQAREKRTWGFEWPASKPEAAGEAVSEDERLLILKMLEEKKITAEEAEQLLSALEGKVD